MRVAIIGAGLAGLATAYFLLKQNCAVTLFDEKGIGGGASGVCSGLLHPYPGLSARRSELAEEAMQMTRMLIRVAEAHTPRIVARQRGIIRKALNEEQRENLKSHCGKWGDVEDLGEDLFLIHSGITVQCENYMHGLFTACHKMGGQLVQKRVNSLEELDFDCKVVAAGYGVKQFFDADVKFLKGQLLRLEGKAPFERSYISKGYISYLEGNSFELGATYEREFGDDSVDQKRAEELLKENLLHYGAESKVVGCKAGVRVAMRDHYLPLVEKRGENCYLFTGLGSRGLLYHALYAKKLAEKIK